MKTLFAVLMVISTLSLSASQKVGKLQIGDDAVLTNVKMEDVTGKSISLDDVRKENGVVVLFSCNTCPFVIYWEDRYNEIRKWADNNEVGMIVLNSNYKKRSGDDSMEAMKLKAKEKNYNFHYVVDKESRLANAFGGQTTPHVFLFDGNYKLAYKGAIDDNAKSADAVSKSYLKDAISSLGAGEPVALKETSPVGCSIKRKTD